MKKIAWLLLLISVGQLAGAQYRRHIIQFTDKKGTGHSLATPSTFLSAKAIARRARQHIAIDSTDLPVSALYLDSLRKLPQVTVINTSRWLNQALIQTNDPNVLNTIATWSFVRTASAAGNRMQHSAAPAIEKFRETITPPAPVAVAPHLRAEGSPSLSYGSTFPQIHIHRGEFLHNHGLTGRGITIAVLDAGFRSYTTNPALDSVRLQNRILGTWDYVANEASVTEDDTHGLYCFSILAANRPGVLVGSAPHASYWLLRTENATSEYPVEEQYWAAAAEFADSAGADMISSSLGYVDFDDPAFDHSYAQRDGNTAMITRAADLAARKGMIVMNSAGNNGARGDDLKYVSCFADGDSVVAVGAVTTSGSIAAFSSWGPNGKGIRKPNIVSVGQGTVIATLSGTPASGNGTSFSNPNMAGLIACLWQAFPETGNMQLIDAVQKSADRYNNPDMHYGYGLPDFQKAFVALVQQQAAATASFSNCIVTLNWTSKDDTSVTYSIARKLPGENTFTPIRSFASTAPVFGPRSYSLHDTLSLAGTGLATYRLMQSIGSDTTFEIATVQQTISNSCFPLNTIRVTPNPFRNELDIALNTPAAVPALTIQVNDMQGRLIYRQPIAHPAGFRRYALYTTGWPPGMYKLTLYDGHKKYLEQQVVKLP